MTRFSAWNVFRNGLNGQKGWSRQWRDPEPKKHYDVVVIGAGLHGLATAYYLAQNHGVRNVAVVEIKNRLSKERRRKRNHPT